MFSSVLEEPWLQGSGQLAVCGECFLVTVVAGFGPFPQRDQGAVAAKVLDGCVRRADPGTETVDSTGLSERGLTNEGHPRRPPDLRPKLLNVDEVPAVDTRVAQ